MIIDKKEYHKKYYQENKERLKALKKKWREENPEKVALTKKRWAQENPEKIKAASDKFRKTEKGRLYFNKQSLAYFKRRYYSDPEFRKKLEEYGKKWRQRNPERVKIFGQTAYRKRIEKRPELKGDWLEKS